MLSSDKTHIVRRGETLTSIAKLTHCRVEDLASANHLANINHLAVGQVLTLPKVRFETLPAAKLQPKQESTAPAETAETSWLEQADDYVMSMHGIAVGLLDALLNRFRVAEANEDIQHKESFAVTKQTQSVAPKHAPPTTPHSQTSNKLADVKQRLKEQLGKEPHVITFKGVKLTENEKRQIMAAVAVCEMNKDGFGTINPDREFGGKGGFKDLKYKHIVHIGLSYGLIQFTQDGGALGKVLTEMRSKNPREFTRIFGGGNADIAQSLITLCTTGRPDLANNQDIPLSGLSHWGKIKNQAKGKELTKLANEDKNKDGKWDLPVTEEIRGKRVQPIKATPAESPSDIWTGTWKQRFLDAGQVTDFQEVQIAAAVKNYMNPMLAMAKKNNIRSTMGLAFLVACSVRWGAHTNPGTKLLFNAAKELGLDVPFKNSADEITAVKAIAGAKALDKKKNHIGNVEMEKLESHRATALLKDELGFLAEDLYDTNTY